VAAVGAANPVFFCPSRRGPQTFELPDKYSPPLTGTTVVHAQCDYAASNRDGTGAVRRYDPLGFRDMLDGSSQTLLIGDKRLNRGKLGSPQDDDNEGYTAGWNEDTIRRTDEGPAPDHVGSGDGEKLFGSSHPGGINVVFVDGSVRSIQYSIDEAAFEALGHRSDGEVVSGY
jgi:prepilin-type processing-associated H-X9-DG protein